MINRYVAQPSTSPPQHKLSTKSVEVDRTEESSRKISKALEIEDEMLDLHQTLESLISHTPQKVIMFIGSREGEGVSTVARAFARVSANKIGKSVLLLDADRTKPTHHLVFGIQPEYGWLDAIKDAQPFDHAVYQIAESTLFVSPCSTKTCFPSAIFASSLIDTFWQEIKQWFDLVIIDSAPLSKSLDSLVIIPKVDGIVFVVEAENTARTVAESAKNRILKVGGNILGTILNKHREHIPRMFSERL